MNDNLNQDYNTDEEEKEIDDQYQDDDSEELEEEEQETEEIEDEDKQEEQEEYDEITYNKESIKIPKSQRQEFLQKGYNYDKVNTRLSEANEKIAEIEKRTGMSYQEILNTLEQQQLEAEAEKIEEEHGISKEIALKIAQQEKQINDIKHQQAIERVKIETAEEKERLKDEPFFNELYNEAISMVNPGINLSTAFYFLRGQKMPELLQNQRKNTQKSNIADIHDSRKRRGVNSGSDGDNSELSPQLNANIRRINAVFGNKDTDIAKYIKNNK